jgi:DNA topoisomerase-6 subunit B
VNQVAGNFETAHEMAARQREISVSEFFLKNRHLLGFDSPAKALLTTVKEAVDNAIDACEEAGILPEIWVELEEMNKDQFRVTVQDNGPGIVEQQIARIFGKLLYGSKFHKLSQSRGQQGMGISAAGMYAQLTTGKPLHVLSRVRGEEDATEMFVSIDTAKNRPELHKKQRVAWDHPHGTRVETRLEAHYVKGRYSVDNYLQQTSIANSHVRIHFQDPRGHQVTYERIGEQLPERPHEIKPHPRGVELGQLIQMLHHTKCRTLRQFLEQEFSRVGRKTATAMIEQAGSRLSERSWPKRIAHAQAHALHRAIGRVRVSAPRTDCLVPIGEDRLREGFLNAEEVEFCVVKTRPAAVYRGNPFQIEVAIAYGHRSQGHASAAETQTVDDSGQESPLRETHDHAPPLIGKADDPVHLIRLANRVPLLYDQSGCAITKAVVQTNWRAYGVQQTKGALPQAPMVILVHIASVWVPFTSEAKEAIAAYPEILKELKLGLQQCGRQLAGHLRQQQRRRHEQTRRAKIDKYLPHVGIALQEILGLSDADRQETLQHLQSVLSQVRRMS